MKKTRTLLDCLIVVGIVLGVAYAMGLLTGFPKGGDAYGYLTKIRLIATYFPHINWNPFWDSGTPFSIWSYPPLPMTATTFIFVNLLGLTPEKSLTVMAAVAFCLLGIGIYGFVSEVTGKRLAGILAVVLLVSSPASWNWWSFGNYVRVFGLGFFSLTLWALSVYLKRFTKSEKSQLWFLLTLIFASLAVSSHLLIGGITLVIVFLYVLFVVPNFGQKLSHWVKFLAIPFLSAAYFYLPLFLTGKAGARFIGVNPAYPVPLNNWFYPVEAQQDFSLSPSLSLSFIVGFILVLAFLFLRKTVLSKFEKGSLLALGIFILGNTFYNGAGFLPFYPETFYIVGFPPITAFSLLSLTWAVGAGLFLGIFLNKYLGKPRLANLFLLGIIILGVFNIFWGMKALRATIRDLTVYGAMQDLGQQVIRLVDPQDFNYRFGTDSGLVADWFTYRYDMPQTRDYFAQGIPHVNWQNWMETAIWAWNNNWNETKFLLDWYAIKYVFVAEPHFNFQKFLSQPEDFSVAQTKTFSIPALTLTQFEYRQASLVVSGTNTPAMLIIGASGEYDVFLRSLAQAGLDSQKIIPIFSEKDVDDFALSELKRFEAVFLYNYSYGSLEKMEKTLGEYVQNGGKLIVETFRGKELESEKLPQFFPVSQTKKADIKFAWNFSPKESEFLKDIKLDGFAEASYLGNPWHVSLALKSALQPGAEVILENNQGILMAAKTEGSGKIIWSGINFPFHLADKKSLEEIKLLQNLFAWFGFDQEYPQVATNYQFIHPEKREIQVLEPAKGILFKETNFMDWSTSSKIYFAGPGFMYTFLEPTKFPQTITFDYRLSLIEKAGFLIAFLVWIYFVVLLLEFFLQKPIISARLGRPFNKRGEGIFSKVFGWWDKEEE